MPGSKGRPDGARPDAEPPSGRSEQARSPLVELGIGAAWLVGTAAVVEILAAVLARSPIAVAVAGAVLVELTATRAGVKWRDGDTKKKPLRLVSAGALVGLALAAVTLVVGAVTGLAHIEVAAPTAALAFGLARATAMGVRDELLYRGISIVTAARAGLSPALGRVFGALAGAAAIALVPGTTFDAIALTFASGLLFAELWRAGPLPAVAAHAAWAFATGPVSHGALLEVAWSSGSQNLGANAHGAPAFIAAGAALVGAFVVMRRASTEPRASKASR